MVRRDATNALTPSGGGAPAARCASPAGASPVPVGVGAPGSRPQVPEGDLCARAGRQEPARRRKPRNGEQARGPQHQVKPAASTEEQSGSRAAHVTVKATSVAGAPKLADDSGGVRGAARVQGESRNTRDPSVQPQSRQGGSYKPKAKSSAAQRESEGIVVPNAVAQSTAANAVQNNAAGGKGPCFGHARCEGKREGMADKIGPNYPGARTCDVQVRQPQDGLWAGAKRQVAHRPRREPGTRSDACVLPPDPCVVPAVHAPSRRPSASRVREIRTHGLKGGPAPSPVKLVFNQ